MIKCKFYSEEIGKCLFDGPPDDCPFDNKETCNCFEPIKENKNDSKIMKERIEREAAMTKKEFIKLIQNAEVDENGNLYYVDNSLNIGNRVYFATVTTICDDFVKTYCYEEDGECGRYDRHFTSNDDTLEIIIIKEPHGSKK